MYRYVFMKSMAVGTFALHDLQHTKPSCIPEEALMCRSACPSAIPDVNVKRKNNSDYDDRVICFRRMSVHVKFIGEPACPFRAHEASPDSLY